MIKINFKLLDFTKIKELFAVEREEALQYEYLSYASKTVLAQTAAKSS